MTESRARQHRLFWQFAATAAAQFLGAFTSRHFLSFQRAVPLEELAMDSEENRTRRGGAAPFSNRKIRNVCGQLDKTAVSVQRRHFLALGA